MPLGQLKSVHRLNFGRPAKVARFRPQSDVWDYFRFLARLIKLRGLAGWVILFDEFELVGTLGIAQRSEAYCNLGRFLFPEGRQALDCTYAVFGIASQFWPAVLVTRQPDRSDTVKVPARLRAKGDPVRAELARRVINALFQDAVVTLEPLPTQEVRRMLEAVVKLHAQGYAWEPKVQVDQLLEATRHDRLRTKIRYAVEYLDLMYLYGEEPLVEAGYLEEMPLAEETEEEAEED
jgi:hypothetical protein